MKIIYREPRKLYKFTACHLHVGFLRIKTRKFILFVLNIFFLFCGTLHSQNSGAYMIPNKIFVGDKATLSVPLPGTLQNTGSIILSAELLPKDPNIDFHRITVEGRSTGNRLLIEFTAFVPGLVELPPITIGDEIFTGLAVTVSSVIDRHTAPELSGPASSLAMPGTTVMLYGTMSVIVILLLFSVWFIFKGSRYLQIWSKKWNRWRLFISIGNTEKNLQKAMLKGGNRRKILDKLSDEFRIFLSFFTGVNCRAMTAREFTINFTDEFKKIRRFPWFDGVFLENFFRRCDDLRFCGTDVKPENIFQLLDDLRFFTLTLKKTKKDKAA